MWKKHSPKFYTRRIAGLPCRVWQAIDGDWRYCVELPDGTELRGEGFARAKRAAEVCETKARNSPSPSPSPSFMLR
jgi:hypothetical protein